MKELAPQIAQNPRYDPPEKRLSSPLPRMDGQHAEKEENKHEDSEGSDSTVVT